MLSTPSISTGVQRYSTSQATQAHTADPGPSGTHTGWQFIPHMDPHLCVTCVVTQGYTHQLVPNPKEITGVPLIPGGLGDFRIGTCQEGKEKCKVTIKDKRTASCMYCPP